MVTFHILDALVQDTICRKTKDSITFTPLEDDSDDEGSGGQKMMMIHLFGSTVDKKPVHAQISGFQPYFYVRLPDDTLTMQKQFKVQLIATIKRREKEEKEALDAWFKQPKDAREAKPSTEILRANLLAGVQMDLVHRKVLYGYTADRIFPFMKLTVCSMGAFRALKKIFLNPDTNAPWFSLRLSADAEEILDVYEANLDPMLRFFHLRDIKPCGWVTTEADMEEGDNGVLSVLPEWDEIGPCSSPPAACAPFKMATWDIECYSESGEFPVPTRGYDRLAKQLVAAAKTTDDAVRLIVEAATYPEAPPRGMDPLRHRRGAAAYNREKLEAALEAARDDFDTVFAGSMDKVEKAPALERILGRRLRFVLPLAGDPVSQIGIVLTQAGVPTEKHIFVLDTCDPIEGVTVHSYKTEKELLVAWAAAMELWNPDMLIGYNTFGFDERYVWKRAEELGLAPKAGYDPDDSSPLLSLSRMAEYGKKVQLEEKFLSSSALGDNTMWIWTTHGRLQIDLFHYIKRSFSLPAYKLDYVCQHFMSGKLSGVDADPRADVWTLKTKSTADVVIGRYVILLDETGDTVTDKLKIVGVDPGKAVLVEPPTGDTVEDQRAAVADAVKWAVVKDDVSPQEIFAAQRGTAADRARIAAYCVQDCDLVVELYKKLDVFNNAMAMANACSVPVSYIFVRGQGIKIESLIFKECNKREQCILVQTTQPRRAADAEVEEEPAAEESYEGAIVLTPTPGFYFKSPIGVADFASLYPSTIISENISHDTLLWSKDYDLAGNFLCYSYGSPAEEAEALEAAKEVPWTHIAFDIWGNKEGDTKKHPEKEKKGLRVCCYAQGKQGTLPEIVAGLLAARKAKRKEAESETDPFKKALLDAEQLAYKLTANSLYGQLGSGTFKVRLQHLAASVTAYGRKQILFARAAIERFYGKDAGRKDCCAETVYGDTDSLFVCFNVRDPATGKLLEGREAIVRTQELTTEAGKLVTTCLKRPHDFEYDKVFAPFIIFSKKRYVGNKYEESPDEYYQNSMGIATKRRDYAGIVKVIYGGAIRILLTERNPVAAAEFVRGKLMDLASGRVSMTQLTLTKSLRSEYKSATPPAHKVLADRIKARDPGNAPASGDRISFLYIQPPAGQLASKSQGDRIETPAFIREKGLQVDAKFYMEHQLLNPISQLFSLIVHELPGCEPPRGKRWSEADSGEREYAAGEYLFRDALDVCDKAASRRGAEKLGLVILGAPAKPKKAAATVEATAPVTQKKRQTTLSFGTPKNSIVAEEYALKAIKTEVKKALKKAEGASEEGSETPTAGAQKRRSPRLSPPSEGKVAQV